MADAVAIMGERKISELPVIDDAGRPVGMIDITDVVAAVPEKAAQLHGGRQVPRVGPPKPKHPLLNSGRPQPRRTA